MDNHGQISQLQNSNDVDRVPQWSGDETLNFLVIRAELDPTFMAIKRNRLLWELISARMDELGYNRSPNQCKSKWENLVTRYKGCEAMHDLEMRHWAFPFYNEMQTIFNARLQRMTWQSEVEFCDDSEMSPSNGGGGRKRKRKEKGVMEECMKQQMEMEKLWIKAYEEREEMREMEWKRRMAVEIERLMVMRWCIERDEERKMREVARADQR